MRFHEKLETTVFVLQLLALGVGGFAIGYGIGCILDAILVVR
jgi:hypothetical protein